MKSLINSVRLMGHVGAAPEVKTFDNGGKIARLRLATNEKQKNAKGEMTEITYWHNLVFRGKQAEIVEKYVDKGEKLAIEGSLINRDYESKSGEKKQITEVKVQEFEFLSSKKNAPQVPKVEDVSDDLPF